MYYNQKINHMDLRDKIVKEKILIPMKSNFKEDAINELLNHLQSLNILSGTIKLNANIREQEKIFTSSAGRGIAYPHATSNEINELVCVLGISLNGIEFNSPDGHKSHIILLTLSSEKSPTEHRKFIARFRSMIDDPKIRSALIESEMCRDILNIINEWEDVDRRKDGLIL